MYMNNRQFYIAAGSESLRYAARFLEARGCSVTAIPTMKVTHLLLPAPAFTPEGSLRGGGELSDLLEKLPENITVLGGNLHHPLLENYRKTDLLQDPWYLARNAAITAECALRVAAQKLPIVLKDTPVLILGWGRIGKSLAQQLKSLGADVAVAARKESDCAIAGALGYGALAIGDLSAQLIRYRIIFNTVPAMVLRDAQMIHCRPDCVKIDLASCPGIGGSGVIWARGLPDKMVPESSGQLIGQTVLGHCLKKEDMQ